MVKNQQGVDRYDSEKDGRKNTLGTGHQVAHAYIDTDIFLNKCSFIYFSMCMARVCSAGYSLPCIYRCSCIFIIWNKIIKLTA